MRNQSIFFGIFAAVGLPCFLLACYFTYSTVQKINTWETKEAVITGFDNQNSPFVAFDYEGKSFEFNSSYSSSDMNNGDAVTVYFPPKQPDQAEIKSFFTLWFLPLFLSLFGIVFGSVGVIGFMIQKRKADAKNELFIQRKGKKISVPVISVDLNTSYTVNGVNPYVITTQWLDPASNMMYTYKSENIWYDPSQLTANKKLIDVYIDPQNPKRYYIDITFLPTSAN